MAFVERHGMVLKSARGSVPSLAEAIAGGPIRGSWWGHPKNHEIFAITNAVVDSGQVLACKLIDGKVTYVHRRLWPSLVKLASRFRKAQLAKVWSEHTETGAHRARETPFPEWVPADVAAAAEQLSVAEAEAILESFLAFGKSAPQGKSSKPRRSSGSG